MKSKQAKFDKLMVLYQSLKGELKVKEDEYPINKETLS